MKYVDAYDHSESGNPGYLFGLNILGGLKTSTNAIAEDRFGIVLKGVKASGQCVYTTDTDLVNSDFDPNVNTVILFG